MDLVARRYPTGYRRSTRRWAGGIPGLDRILSGLSGGLGAGGLGSAEAAGALGKIFYCHIAIRKTFLRWM